MSKRTCDVDECDKLHRARGLCSTHYNRRHLPDRYRTVTVQCSWCGADCEKSPGRTDRYKRLFCSDVCKGAHYEIANRRRWLVVVGPPTYRHIPESHPARRPAPSPPRTFVAGPCRRCGTPYVIIDQTAARYCSRQCARSDAKTRRRATQHDAYVEPVHRAEVFTRDGWRCQLCRRLVPARYRDAHIWRRYAGRKLPDLAPVIDHIIPLADGGEHSMANTQCAHFRCNSIKGAGVHGDGEQLRLLASS